MKEKVYLTVGTLWKQEDPYAEDWVKLVKFLGADRIIIYDREFNFVPNKFRDDQTVIVKQWIDDGAHLHADAWASLIKDCQTETPSDWLALFDNDQILVPEITPRTKHPTNDMRDILREYDEPHIASVQFNWKTFGSGGAVEWDKTKSLYERFTRRCQDNAPINNHTQTVCIPSRCKAIKPADPHHVFPEGRYVAVNENNQPIKSPFNIPPTQQVAWFAHYITKSKQEYEIKCGKGRADVYKQSVNAATFDGYEAFCNAEEELRVRELWGKANGQ